MLYRELIHLGLSEKEARVYISSLELGPSPVQKISQKAGVNRATTYTNIDSLVALGLMNSYKDGKKFQFYAEAPDKIVYLLVKKQERDVREQEAGLAEIIPALKAIQTHGSGEVPIVRYFEGREGIKELVREMFLTGNGGNGGEESIIRAIFPRDLIFQFFTKEENEELRALRQIRNIKYKAIVSADTVPDDLRHDENMRVVSTKDLNINCDIAFYHDQVRFISLKEPLAGIIIRDKNIANDFKQMFEIIWNNGLRDNSRVTAE